MLTNAYTRLAQTIARRLKQNPPLRRIGDLIGGLDRDAYAEELSSN
jgi:hypothetical protein